MKRTRSKRRTNLGKEKDKKLKEKLVPNLSQQRTLTLKLTFQLHPLPCIPQTRTIHYVFHIISCAHKHQYRKTYLSPSSKPMPLNTDISVHRQNSQGLSKALGEAVSCVKVEALNVGIKMYRLLAQISLLRATTL